ncbi:hypothetical protein BDA96_02G223000 [Sorghum bicolor]|uniref:Uncharacterized protein n=1 Tax=Sorghum bicolor TaxID=4558 RepID=A0A921RQF8_SORBI|nr:hypothetical protein BDA96_02G223000 [Sorghum bicolor]
MSIEQKLIITNWQNLLLNGLGENTMLKSAHGDLSGYNVLLAMHAWNGKRIETSICNNDNYEVRKHILLHLLTYTGNKNIANIPKGVRDHLERYISLTSKKQ